MSVTVLPRNKLKLSDCAEAPAITYYYLTMTEVEELAGSIAFLDCLCGEPEAKDKISRAHQILERVLGADAHFLYGRDEDAA